MGFRRKVLGLTHPGNAAV